MVSYKIAVLDLERMSYATMIRLYEIYFRFLNDNINFPYSDVDELLDSYELLYNKTFNGRVFKNFLNVINKEEMDKDLIRLSRNEIVMNVSKKILGLVYFDVFKYVPKNDLDSDRIFNKLFPILKNFSPYEIAEIYVRFKISASIRGVIIDSDVMARLQQIFVNSIMLVLSNNSNNRDCSDSFCNYDYICDRILNEPVLIVNEKKYVR